jgi:thioredoxin reductase
MAENILIVGGSPAAHMCAIYNHTANLSPVVINTQARGFDGASKVAAVLDCRTSEDFSRLVREQSQNMGIRVLDERVVSIAESSSGFSVKTDKTTYECRALVIDDPEVEKTYRTALSGEGIFYTSRFIPYNEAIVVAAAGCKAAFDVKDYLSA